MMPVVRSMASSSSIIIIVVISIITIYAVFHTRKHTYLRPELQHVALDRHRFTKCKDRDGKVGKAISIRFDRLVVEQLVQFQADEARNQGGGGGNGCIGRGRREM